MTVSGSSMSVAYTEILRNFCRFFGYDETNLTAKQEQDFTDCLKSGIHRVIHPDLVPTLGPQAHQWSWARPVWNMTTASGHRRYTLPVDFERFIADICFAPVQGEYHTIPYFPASRLTHLATTEESTGSPMMYSLEPVATEGTTEQVWQLVLHPTPDGAYKLVGQYQLGARMLSENNPYPPGGPGMGHLYIAATLAAGELLIDGAPGQWTAEFQRELMGEISRDMLRQPSRLGYAGDGPGGIPGTRSAARRMFRGLTSGLTTYNGGTEF